MTQTKPSREALSAAKIIARERVELTIEAAAHIIDRETQAPEMYELLSTIIKWYENSGSTEPCAGSVDLWSAARRIKAAIDGE